MTTQMRWELLAIASVFWFTLSIVTALDAQESSDGRLALPLVLMCQTILLLFATIIVFKAKRNKVRVAWPSLDKGGCLIFLGSSILYLVILVRLLSFSHFGGGVGSFSFGFKCDGDVCEKNEAFSLSFNTFGHVIQGCLSFFLFSDILIGGIKEIWSKSANREKRQMILLYMKESTGICSCIYPIYNILKRALLHSDTFSTSSFWNNGSEWACGFALGTCAIFSYYAIIYSSPTKLNESDSDKKERFQNLEILREYEQQLPKARIASGIALILVALLSIILLVATWNNFETATDADDSEDVFTIVMLIVVFFLIFGVLVLFLFSLQKVDSESKVEMDITIEMRNSEPNVQMDLTIEKRDVEAFPL